MRLFPSDRLLSRHHASGTGFVYDREASEKILYGLWPRAVADGFSPRTPIVIRNVCGRDRASLIRAATLFDSSSGATVRLEEVVAEQEECSITFRPAVPLREATRYLFFLNRSEPGVRQSQKSSLSEAAQKLRAEIVEKRGIAQDRILFADSFTIRSTASILSPLLYLQNILLSHHPFDAVIDVVEPIEGAFRIRGHLTLPDFCPQGRCRIVRNVYNVSLDTQMRSVEFQLLVPASRRIDGYLLVTGFEKGAMFESAPLFQTVAKESGHVAVFVDSEIHPGEISGVEGADRWVISWMYEISMSQLLSRRIPALIREYDASISLRDQLPITGCAIDDEFSPSGLLLNPFVRRMILFRNRDPIYRIVEMDDDPTGGFETEGLRYSFYRELFGKKREWGPLRDKKVIYIRSLYDQVELNSVRRFLLP